MPEMGEIRMFSYDWRTTDEWLPCDGRMLKVQEHQALFSVIGIVFGGDGRTTFALPDLRGRVIVGAGKGSPNPYARGASGGAEAVALKVENMPSHAHRVTGATNAGNTNLANKDVLSSCGENSIVTTPQNLYAPPAVPMVPLNPEVIFAIGDSEAHNNMQPFTAINYSICIKGEYPQREGSPNRP